MSTELRGPVELAPPCVPPPWTLTYTPSPVWQGRYGGPSGVSQQSPGSTHRRPQAPSSMYTRPGNMWPVLYVKH